MSDIAEQNSQGASFLSKTLILLLFAAGAISIALAGQGYLSAGLEGAWQVHLGVMLLGFLQVLAFTFVSRSRNRNDDRYHALASICSNGVWYLTFNSVFFYSLFEAVRPEDGAIPYGLFLPFTVGTIAGGLLAAACSQKIEHWLKLCAGEKVSENLEKQTLRELVADQMRDVARRWWLYAAFLGIALYFLFTAHAFEQVAGLMLLAYGQNIFFSLSSRAKNRGSALYIVITTICGSLAFFFILHELIVEGMPLALFAPYTVATALGSISGARVSMIIERLFGINPDDHTQEEVKSEKERRVARENILWAAVLSAGVVAMLATVLFTGTPVVALMIVLLAAFLSSGTHILASRAGNRNNLPYHFVTRIFWAFGWFFFAAAMVYSQMGVVFLAPFLVGNILGSLFGFNLAIYIEKKLCAVMDVQDNTAQA